MSHLRSKCPVIPNLSSPLLLLISTPRQPNQRNAQSVTQCIPTAPQWQAADTNFHSSSRWSPLSPSPSSSKYMSLTLSSSWLHLPKSIYDRRVFIKVICLKESVTGWTCRKLISVHSLYPQNWVHFPSLKIIPLRNKTVSKNLYSWSEILSKNNFDSPYLICPSF